MDTLPIPDVPLKTCIKAKNKSISLLKTIGAVNYLNHLNLSSKNCKYSATLHWEMLPNIYNLMVIAIFRHQAEYLPKAFIVN